MDAGSVSIEDRLRRLEDRLAIIDLIASYGPAVDRGDSSAASDLWAPEGAYDVGGMIRVEGADAIGALFDGPTHQSLVAQGVAHVLSTPRIAITGDRACAVNYSCMFVRGVNGFTTQRVAANRWILTRVDGSWRVTERINRLLDGSADARALLAEDA